jgi:hypothetical protein
VSVVQGITPLRATPEALELELELTTGIRGFSRVLDDELLEADGEGEPPTFRLR